MVVFSWLIFTSPLEVLYVWVSLVVEKPPFPHNFFLMCCWSVEKCCCHVKWGQEKLCYTPLACLVILIVCTRYFRVPLRSSRKKSVMPPSGRHINNGDISDASDIADHSPQNSITSINSISSLLKEKIAVSSYRYQNWQESW